LITSSRFYHIFHTIERHNNSQGRGKSFEVGGAIWLRGVGTQIPQRDPDAPQKRAL